MHSDARQIAALVPMQGLLAALSFDVNKRTRRSRCLIHGGKNPNTFAWRDDGRWYCHSCGAGGDKISLVRAVRNCEFRNAVEFLASLAGVQFLANRMSRSEIEQLRSERTALLKDAAVVLAQDGSSWQNAQNAVLQLEAIRRNAGRRLKEISEGSPKRWCGEMEWCWAALAEVSSEMPRASAAYTIASFGKIEHRLCFSLGLAASDKLIGDALDNGYVTDERGHRFEVPL